MPPQPIVVLLAGLDNAGKTKILYHSKLGDLRNLTRSEVNFEPTPAFNYEVVPRTYEAKKFALHMWDLSGNVHLRPMWQHFFNSAKPDVVAFVVDALDETRLEEAREELQLVLHNPALTNTIKVVLLNLKGTEESLTTASPARVAYLQSRLGLSPNSSGGTAYAKSVSASVRLIEVNLGHQNMGINAALNYICKRFMERSTGGRPLLAAASQAAAAAAAAGV